MKSNKIVLTKLLYPLIMFRVFIAPFGQKLRKNGMKGIEFGQITNRFKRL